MQENIITRIKDHQSKVRKNLVQLANHAYHSAKLSPDNNPLNLERDQANKYNRFQFAFDPTQDFESQQNLFTDVFGNDAQNAFKQLKAEHPFGVEIWVNPKNSSKHPLAERQGFLAATSTLNGAQLLLEDLFKEQEKFINAYFDIGEKKQRQHTRLLTKKARILETIQEEYKYTIDIINASYNSTFSVTERTKQFKQIKKAITHFQHFAIAQLTAFKMLDGQKPSHKDFKKIHTLLSLYEQKKSFTEHSAEENIFNRDILTIDVKEETNNQIQISDTHFHKRNYSLTDAQIELKQLEQPGLQIAHLQPTATSHNPDYLLGNSALVEQGKYTDPTAPKVKIHFLDARHSSPAPSQMYDKDSVDRHETTYRAFLNMEQHLQQLRTTTIASILGQNFPDFSSAQIKKLSAAISLELSGSLRNREITQPEFISTIREAAKDISDNVIDVLSNHHDSIIDIKSIHTHLITATGIGSHLKNQQYQFEDARIAQYATWHHGAAYIYMANGINKGRYFDGKYKAQGCNAVVLVELFKKLVHSGATTTDISFNDYDRQLRQIQKCSHDYLAQTEKYLHDKIKYDHLQNVVKLLRIDLVKLKQLTFDATIIKELETKIKKKEVELQNQKTDLDIDTALLTEKRKVLETEEEKLFKIAIVLNKQIHATLNSLRTANADRLTLQAFRLIEVLFNDTNILGINKWKLSKNNGLMQALIHLTAQLVGIFSSGGCASANNRETLLAMLVTELSKLANGSTELNEEYLSSLSKQAQEHYFTHIGNEQTALDHCALPNAGIEISSDVSENENLTKISTNSQSGIVQNQPQQRLPHQVETPDGAATSIKHASTFLRNEAKNPKRNNSSAFADINLSPQKAKIRYEEFKKTQKKQKSSDAPGHHKKSIEPVRQALNQEATAPANSNHANQTSTKLSVTKERSLYAKLAAHLRAQEQSKEPLNITKLHKLAIRDEIYQWWSHQSHRSSMNEITKKLLSFAQEQERELKLENKKIALRAVLIEITNWSRTCLIPSNTVNELRNKLQCRMFALITEEQANAMPIADTQNYKQLKQFIDQVYALSIVQQSNFGNGWKQIKALYQFYNPVDPSLNELLNILEQLRDIADTRDEDSTSKFAKMGLFHYGEKRPSWLRDLYSILITNPVAHSITKPWVEDDTLLGKTAREAINEIESIQVIKVTDDLTIAEAPSPQVFNSNNT